MLLTGLDVTGKRASINRHEKSVMCAKKMNIIANFIHCKMRGEDFAGIFRISEIFTVPEL
jgi:hypothetical protein